MTATVQPAREAIATALPGARAAAATLYYYFAGRAETD